MKNTIHRRHLLAIAGTMPMLAACGTTSADQAIGKVSADISIIANGLKGVLTQLGTLNIAGLTPAIMATVGNAVADIEGVATAIAGVTSTAAAQPLVQKVETYVNVIVTALAALPLPPPISIALQAAAILLPIIEAAVGLVVNNLKAAGGMTPDEARLILEGTAAGRPGAPRGSYMRPRSFFRWQ